MPSSCPSLHKWFLNSIEIGSKSKLREIIIYVREEITNKMLTKHKFLDDVEVLFIDINF